MSAFTELTRVCCAGAVAFATIAACSDAPNAPAGIPPDTAVNAPQVPAAPAPATGATFFAEPFDDNALAARGWYDNTALTLDASQTSSSGSAAQFHFTPGATTPTSGASVRHKFTASNSVYVSYDVKYSANWTGSGRAYHPHEFYVLSTMDDDAGALANNWLTFYVEHIFENGGRPRLQLQDSKSVNSSGTLPSSLVGVTEDRSVGGCNGVSEPGFASDCFNAGGWYSAKRIDGPVVLQQTAGPGYKGDWNRVEVFAQLNTVQNGVGIADGVLQYWFNGVLVIDQHNVVFRTGARAALQFNQFVIAPYIGDGSPVDQSMWVDNLVVAATRVEV